MSLAPSSAPRQPRSPSTSSSSSEELEFRAVSGQGQGILEGTRFPAARGLAGFALASRQSLAVEDVTRDPRFARDVAERSGYIPTSIMVAPLLIEDEALGVLSLLDRQSRETLSMQELDLLGALATQAAHAVSMLQAGHRVQQALRGEARGTALLAALAQRLERLEPDRQETAVALLSSLVALIG